MTTEPFDDWIASLEDRAQVGDAAAVLDELNAAAVDALGEQELGRVRGLAICCLEWCGMDPLAKGLADELCAGDPRVALSAGIECSDLDELEYAEDMFRTLGEKWPDSIYPPLNLGIVLQKLGEHEKAIACFDTALRIENGFAPAMLERARSFHDLGEFDTASRAYREYLHLEPGDAWQWVSLGIVESEREEFGSALEAYDRARRADPTCLSAHYNFGVTASRMEDAELLQNAIDSLCEHGPDDCRHFLLRAYQIEDESPEEAWDLAMKAVEASDVAEDAELCEHSLEVALNVGMRNELLERCEVFIDKALGDPNTPPPVLDAERRLRGPHAADASQWTVRLEVEVTDPGALLALTGDDDYRGPGMGYIRVYRVWATTAGEAEETATACEDRTGYGRVVDVVDVEHHEGMFDEPLGVEWRSEMFGFELEGGT